jgi:hypothetical protein
MKNTENPFKKIIVPKMKGKEDNIKMYIKEIDFDGKPSPEVKLDFNETILSFVTTNALTSWLII